MSTVAGQTAGRQGPKSRIGAAAAGIDAISTTRTARFIGLAVAVIIGLTGSLAIATPAAAAVPGLIRVSATSGSTAHDAKIIVVACPAGKQLVGTGARIDGGLGKVVLTSLQPNGSPTVAPTSLTAQAAETDPISRSWSLTAYGICANPLPGLVRIAATSSDNQSEDAKAARAVCPTGKKVVGTGFRIGLGRGQVSIGGVRFLNISADPVPNHVFVHAREADLYDGYWTLTAYAICATPPAGLRVYRAVGFSDPDGNTGSTVVAPCPPLKGMLGAGFRTQPDGPNPNIVVDNVLDDFTPNGGSTTAPTSVKVTHYEEDSPTYAWYTTAYAICASLFKTA
jgi:hypothetical protein